MELYIHIPFCVRKCNYCDFLSFPCGNSCGDGSVVKYVDALCAELEFLAGRYKDTVFTTAFIGGGTPSILPAELMEKVLKAASRLMGGAPGEYTIECNPGTVSADKLALYRKYGINRISFGLQSTDDSELKMLGRIHDYEQFLESYRLAREAGFDNINIDLISAIPGQTVDSWERTLKTVAELNPEHISAYSLIIEPGTKFWDMYGEDRTALPDEDSEREMYRLTARILADYGYERYEISNYAHPGRASKHNLGYWTGEEYIGAGLGASSYVRAGTEPGDDSSEMLRYRNTDSLPDYIDACGHNKIEAQQTVEETLDKEDLMAEYMILHLRLTSGADVEEFRRLFGVEAEEKYADIIRKYKALGLIKTESGRIALTEDGLDVSNTVMAEFLP